MPPCKSQFHATKIEQKAKSSQQNHRQTTNFHACFKHTAAYLIIVWAKKNLNEIIFTRFFYLLFLKFSIFLRKFWFKKTGVKNTVLGKIVLYSDCIKENFWFLSQFIDRCNVQK